MKTKTLLILLAVVCSTAVMGFSQKRHGKGTIEERINRRLDKMDEVVKFTGNQRNDLKILFTDLAKKAKDAFCANEIGTDAMQNAMKGIKEERRKGVEKILTKDQINAWKEFKKSQKGKRDNDQQDPNKDFKEK